MDQQYTEQDARVVRDLKKIEDDYHLASVTLSERFMLAAVQAIKKAAHETFQVIENDWTATLADSAWKATRGVTVDATIDLAEVCADEDREYCWLTAATAGGPTRLGLELVFRPGLHETSQKIIRDDKLMAAIWKTGFMRDETDAWLFIPIVVPSLLLAEGLTTNDLDKALAPVTKAVEQVTAAKAEIDKIVELVRTAAKVTR